MFHPKGPSLLELLSEGLTSTDRGYDLLAPKFELTPFRTPDVVLQAAAEALTEVVEQGLDVCCGTGAALRFIRPRCRVLTGLDRSQGMLGEACRLLAGEAGAPVHLVQGDVLALPFPERFDLVTCFGAFGHILPRDQPRMVQEIFRVLRPGGRFVFATAPRPSPLRPGWWIAHGFNAAMHLRNALIKPEFVMYYLTFLLPQATAQLQEAGFQVHLSDATLPKPYARLRLVIARKPS